MESLGGEITPAFIALCKVARDTGHKREHDPWAVKLYAEGYEKKIG